MFLFPFDLRDLCVSIKDGNLRNTASIVGCKQTAWTLRYNDLISTMSSQSARRRVYLNQPEVCRLGERLVLVEPLIDGTYAKFNSNSGWVNEGYNMMQVRVKRQKLFKPMLVQYSLLKL